MVRIILHWYIWNNYVVFHSSRPTYTPGLDAITPVHLKFYAAITLGGKSPLFCIVQGVYHP